MRTIKFRGKANHPESLRYGTFVYGSLITRGDIDPLINTNDNHCPIDVMVDPNTIGQFTGLYDKNGKEIYEGDIVKHSSGFGGIITWNSHGYFYIMPEYRENKEEQQCTPLGTMLKAEDFAIIGNIHDGKEETE